MLETVGMKMTVTKNTRYDSRVFTPWSILSAFFRCQFRLKVKPYRHLEKNWCVFELFFLFQYRCLTHIFSPQAKHTHTRSPARSHTHTHARTHTHTHTQSDRKVALMRISLVLITCMSCVITKPEFCICENKSADQLRGYNDYMIYNLSTS